MYDLLDTDRSGELSYSEFLECITRAENEDLRKQLLMVRLQLGEMNDAFQAVKMQGSWTRQSPPSNPDAPFTEADLTPASAFTTSDVEREIKSAQKQIEEQQSLVGRRIANSVEVCVLEEQKVRLDVCAGGGNINTARDSEGRLVPVQAQSLQTHALPQLMEKAAMKLCLTTELIRRLF